MSHEVRKDSTGDISPDVSLRGEGTVWTLLVVSNSREE